MSAPMVQDICPSLKLSCQVCMQKAATALASKAHTGSSKAESQMQRMFHLELTYSQNVSSTSQISDSYRIIQHTLDGAGSWRRISIGFIESILDVESDRRWPAADTFTDDPFVRRTLQTCSEVGSQRTRLIGIRPGALTGTVE
jgi:hypothetical protein